MDTPPNSPTPDWGTLGPGSDIQPTSGLEIKLSSKQGPQSPQLQILARVRIVLAFASAIMIAAFLLGQYMFFRAKSTVRGLQAANSRPRIASPKFDTPQQRAAELLLRQAIAHNETAVAQIEASAPAWQGHIALTPQLNTMIKAGLDAKDLSVRSATIQLDLAAMNVRQDAESVDRLAQQADSTDHATRIWAIWTLGLLGSRAIERDRITDLLIAHLRDTDFESRHWAVEALSYVATDTAIEPLLKTLHDDPNSRIRERAACGLAESGMFTNDQQRTAIPTLLMYSDDPSLDAQTHAWVFHALRDITSQNLPDDAAAWRNWYDNNR
jgi:HEAT repeat protein